MSPGQLPRAVDASILVPTSPFVAEAFPYPQCLLGSLLHYWQAFDPELA